MAEKSSSSASTGKYTKLFKAGSVTGKASKAKKRRSRQKKEKAAQMTPENVQIDESLLLSTADHTESNSEHKELGQNSGESEEIFSQEMEREPITELAPSSDVLEASTSKLEVAEGTSDSKDLKEPLLPTSDESEEGLAAAKRKELPNERANNDGEGKVIAADESLGQQTSSKKRMDLLSFGRSKKSKTQRAKSDPSKASGHSGSRIKTKSKSLGKENEQEPSDNRDAVKDVDNSPEDAETVENNEGEIYVSERAQDVMNAAGSNKGKKFKPLAGLRRHKKKANSPKSASAEETNIEENEEVQEEPIQPACDEVFAEENGDKVSEEDEQTEPNEDVKKKSAGKKFGPLRSFRRSRPTKKSTEAERDGGGEIKEQLEKSQESGDEEENQQDPDEQEPSGVYTEGLNEERTGTDKENSELVPEEDEIQDECDAVDDADTETMSTTKKGKKKGLLRRQMKKIWSTNGKNKEASNTEKPGSESNAEENVADEGSEIQEEQVKSQNPSPNSPAEASSEESQESSEKVVTDREERELADSTVGGKSDEMNLKAAPIKLAEKTGLFGRQIKKIKVPIKKRKEEKEDEANLTEMSPGASGADNKEITKQVKRKKSGFQKISNALKKKKSKEEGCQKEDEIEMDLDQGPKEKEPQETDSQKVSAEVDVEGCQREDEIDLDQGPREKEPQETDYQKVSAEVDAEGRSETEDENVPQEEMEKVNDNEEVKENPRESSDEEELSEAVEQNENCQDASAIVKAYKAYGNLMKPVMQELVTKMANRAAEPVVEPEDDSELTKSSEFDDDHSLTEITSDSSPSFADTYNEDTVYEDPSNSETDKPQKQERKGDQGGKSSDDELSTKEADAVEESSECVPSTPEAEREKNSADQGETSREELEREVDLDQPGETSDLSSSQTAPSKGRKEEWILVNHFEVSHELSRQLKVLAMDSFEGSAGCCSLM